MSREANTRLTAELAKQGMVLNDISPEERARMRQHVQPVIDKYTKQVGEELVKQAQADIGKVRTAAK